MNRRDFIRTAAGAASGLLILKPGTALAYQANSAVRLGLLGCGSRGTHVATSFRTLPRKWWRLGTCSAINWRPAALISTR